MWAAAAMPDRCWPHRSLNASCCHFRGLRIRPPAQLLTLLGADTEIQLDANSPFAGKLLIFELELIKIEEPSVASA